MVLFFKTRLPIRIFVDQDAEHHRNLSCRSAKAECRDAAPHREGLVQRDNLSGIGGLELVFQFDHIFDHGDFGQGWSD